jgi:hypothetical protein
MIIRLSGSFVILITRIMRVFRECKLIMITRLSSLELPRLRLLGLLKLKLIRIVLKVIRGLGLNRLLGNSNFLRSIELKSTKTMMNLARLYKCLVTRHAGLLQTREQSHRWPDA